MLDIEQYRSNQAIEIFVFGETDKLCQFSTEIQKEMF